LKESCDKWIGKPANSPKSIMPLCLDLIPIVGLKTGKSFILFTKIKVGYFG
jgi:hypothetical protein